MAIKMDGITIPIGFDSTEVTKSIQEINKESRDVFKELGKVEKALKFSPDSTELMAQKMKLLGDQVGQTEDKLELLKKAHQEASKNTDTKEGQDAYRNLSREIIETESKLELYQSRLQKTKDEMNENVSSMDKMADGLKKTGDRLEKTGEKMTEVGTVATKGVTAPILGIGTASIVAWKEVDSAVDSIIAGTGATGDSAVEMEKTFKSVAKRVPGSLDEIATSVGNLNTEFGLTGQELEDATEQAQRYAWVHKIDVGNAVSSVAKVMKASQKEPEEFADVLSKLTTASQDSGVSVETLTGLYEKNGSTLRNLGFDFEESISMMGQWEHNGLNSEEMLKGLQKYMINTSDETKKLSQTFEKETETLEVLNREYEEIQKTKGDTKEENEKLRKKEKELEQAIKEQTGVVEESGKVFQDSTMANKDEFAKLVEAIESGVDPQENMNTAIDVFGKKNGPAFVDAIKNGKVNFEDFTETVRDGGDRLTDTFEQMRSPTDDFEESLKELKIIGSELGGDIIESSIPIIEEFAKKVSELGEWFGSLTDDQRENIIEMGLIIGAVGPVLIVMGKLTTAVGKVATASGKAITGITSMFKSGGIFASGGKMASLAGPVGIATVAVGLLAIAVHDAQQPQRDYQKHISDTIGSIDNFSNAVETATPLIEDFNDVSTRYDESIKAKSDQITKLEPEITKMLSDNVTARTNLTEQEMDKLKEYMGLLDSLNEDIAKKYQVRLKVLEEQLKEEEKLNSDAAAEYVATYNKADAELTKNAKESHITKLVNLEAMLENEKNLRAEGKTKEADEERKRYEELKLIADQAYEEEIANINLSTANSLVALKDKFKEVNKAEFDNLDEIGKIREEEQAIQDKYNREMKELKESGIMSTSRVIAEENRISKERNHAMDKLLKENNDLWDDSTKEVAGAMMEQVANIILHGGEIDEETANMVDAYLATMSQADDGGQAFKDSMKNSINAIVEREPELRGEATDLINSFNSTIDGMKEGKYKVGGDTIGLLSSGITSAEDRVARASRSVRNTAQDNLKPNRNDLIQSGKAYDEGVAKGIDKYAYLVENSASKMAGRTKRAFDEKLSIHSPAREMVPSGKAIPQGTAVGIKEDAHLVEDAMKDLADIPKDISWTADPIVASDFKRASQNTSGFNSYPSITINNPQIDNMERVRQLAEELYRLQNQRR